MGELLGYRNQAQVSRHESAKALPLLVSAIGYHIIFRVPVRSLFPEIYEDVCNEIEERLRNLETSLRNRTVRGSRAEASAQTLIWMMNRRERDIKTVNAD
jgi:hypothetical protein